MNQKFKELLPNPFAVDYQHKDGPLDLYTEVEMQKFAEKIINECAMLTLDYKNEDHYNGWLDFRDKIREHFSVSPIRIKPTCHNIESGSCKLGNLLCAYPDCEEIDDEIDVQQNIDEFYADFMSKHEKIIS